MQWYNKIADRQKVKNFKKDMPGIDIGDFGEIDDLYFKKIESKSDDKNEKKQFTFDFSSCRKFLFNSDFTN